MSRRQGRRKTSRSRKRAPARTRPAAPALPAGERGEVVDALADRLEHHEVSPTLTGGDIDADWQGADSSGDEAVGGSVATPDQDVVDEIGRALGVEQDADAEVHTSDEILAARARRYWSFERRAIERGEM